MFNMDPASLAVTFLFSSIGFIYAAYGKKMQEYSFILAGVLLMIYSYAIDGVALNLVLGILLSLSPFMLRRYF